MTLIIIPNVMYRQLRPNELPSIPRVATGLQFLHSLHFSLEIRSVFWLLSWLALWIFVLTMIGEKGTSVSCNYWTWTGTWTWTWTRSDPGLGSFCFYCDLNLRVSHFVLCLHPVFSSLSFPSLHLFISFFTTFWTINTSTEYKSWLNHTNDGLQLKYYLLYTFLLLIVSQYFLIWKGFRFLTWQ